MSILSETHYWWSADHFLNFWTVSFWHCCFNAVFLNFCLCSVDLKQISSDLWADIQYSLQQKDEWEFLFTQHQTRLRTSKLYSLASWWWRPLSWMLANLHQHQISHTHLEWHFSSFSSRFSADSSILSIVLFLC